MAPGSEEFRQYLRDRERGLLARASEAGLFGHRATTGVARERVLHEPLREILPARYGLTSGVVKDSSGSTSGQWDVLVYDHIDAPILYRSGDSAVLPVESLLACISVKTTVDKPGIYEAARATGQLREMNRRYLGRAPAPGRSPAVFLFGFRGINLDTIREHVLGACENPASAKVLNGVVVLGAGLVLPSSTDGRLGRIEEATRYEVALSTDGAFGIFVGILWAALVQAGRAAPNLLSYMRMGELLDPPYRTPGFEHRDSESDEKPAAE